jgi:hypothetical protein
MLTIIFIVILLSTDDGSQCISVCPLDEKGVGDGYHVIIRKTRRWNTVGNMLGVCKARCTHVK